VLMVMPNEGKARALALLFGQGGATPGTLSCRLFSNDVTPTDTFTLASFTEASFTGYAAVSVAPGDWDAPTVVSDVGQIDKTTPPVFTCTGGSPQDVYGWYLVDPGASLVLFTQRFDAPRTMVMGSTESLSPFRIKDKTFA